MEMPRNSGAFLFCQSRVHSTHAHLRASVLNITSVPMPVAIVGS